MEKIFDLASYLKISGNQAAQKRKDALKQGIHVPMLLQADISVRCNLSCPDCCRQCIHIEYKERLLQVREWDVLFREAEQLGVRFITLAGGEPLLEKGILERAACYSDIWFLVFTNGTLLDGPYYQFFSDHRNLIPVLCMEICTNLDVSKMGRASYRYESLIHSMDMLGNRDIVYGACATLTTENRRRLATRGFLDGLNRKKCNGMAFIEYGMDGIWDDSLGFKENEWQEIEAELYDIQKEYHDMILCSFPKNGRFLERLYGEPEKSFRVTADGYVSPTLHRENISWGNLKNTSLREILMEPRFC